MTEATTEMLFSQPHPLTGGRPLYIADSLFAQARKRARRGQFWSRLTGRSRGMLDLKQVRAACTIEAESDGGIRTVPLSQIRGSEGRSRYFDCDLNPLYDRARGRWIGIARARQQDKVLPLVVLVQVGDVYFVRDGHHRISVARALGQIDIEARVTIWQVAGPLPWEAPGQAPSPGLMARSLGIGRALENLQRMGARLWERAVLAVQGQWVPVG
jgi:hypothetical protein